MDEDRIPGEEHPVDKPEVDSHHSGSIKFTRRAVLIGAASTLAVSQVTAAENGHLDVYYGDAKRKSLVIVWVDGQKQSYEWRLQASTFTEETGGSGGRFTLRRLSDGWRADLPGCSFPGGYAFDLGINALWQPGNNQQPKLILTLTVSGKSIVLRQDELATFLKTGTPKEVAQVDEIAGRLDKDQLARLADRLFGASFDVSKAKDVALVFHHGGYWILRAGPRPIPKTPMVASTSGFSALSSEGVNLPFRLMAFNIFSGIAGGGTAFTLRTDLDKDDVRSLFSGDGAPVGQSDANVETIRVLYGLAIHGKAAPEPTDDLWSGSVALGTAPAGETAALDLIDPRQAGKDQSAYLAWRNEGDANPILALDIPATLVIQRGGGAPRSEFSDTRARLWRLLDSKKAPKIVASLTPQRAPMRIRTRWGEFSTAPLPSLPPRPGVKAHGATVRVGGVGAKAKRKLSHFAASVALESAPVNVGSQSLDRMLLDKTKLDPQQTALRNASYLFSQMLFNEAECLFVIKDVPRVHAWHGLPPPVTEPPQAEAVIHLGEIGGVPYPVRISLNRATLMVRRPVDLLALTYRFQDLVLEREATGWFVKPDRRLAAFLPAGEPTPPPSAPLICGDKSPEADEPQRYQERTDPRPLLAVDFPAQHVAEQAFFRRLKPEPKLAVPPAGFEPSPEQVEILRTGSTVKERSAVRVTVSSEQDKVAPKAPNMGERETQEFKDWTRFVQLRLKMKDIPGPDDQKIYIGPAFLDLETARWARKFQRDIDAGVSVASVEDEIARLLEDVPEVELQPSVVMDLRKKFGIADSVNEDYPALATSPAEIIAWLDARNEIKASRDFTYAAFAEYYKPDKKKVGPFYGRRTVLAQVLRLGGQALDEAKKIAATFAAFDLEQNQEPLQIPAEARVSGGSRLVFRIPADDFEGGRPDNLDGAPAGAFPLTIEALTNWGAFDLAVVRRAEKVFEPLAGWESTDPDVAKDWSARPLGGQRPRWARDETRDEAAKLLHQGITRGDAWTVRHDEQRNLGGMSGCPVPPPLREGGITAVQRMSEVVAGVHEPTSFETSIEIPFRLMLSPAQDANWRTQLVLPPELNLLPPVRRIAPLWFAQLDETPGTSSVRAVWSPDFRPEALLDPDVGGPPHGPWAPWALSRDVTSRFPYDEYDKDIFGKEKETQPERFRTGLDAADRHELVALTSLHGLPARGRRKTDGTLADGSQIDPPPGFRLRHAENEHLDQEGKDTAKDYSAIYRPQALGVSELTLTALGGSFDADTNFVPPASARIVPTRLWKRDYNDTEPGQPLFDAFSIERWRQSTRLGRDIRSEVVYKGFLFPLGHRCSLVKLTERLFVSAPTSDGLVGPPVAFLIQRMFLRIGIPVKKYPAVGQPNGGRRWPTQQLEILTRVTPDILDPADIDSSGSETEAPTGRLLLRTETGALRPGLVFWPRVRPRKGGEIKFEMQIDGRGARTRMPLVFVDNTAANDENTMKALNNYYNALFETSDGTPDVRRVLQLGGDKRRYAQETEPDGTSFETRYWTVEAEGQEKGIAKVNDDRSFTFDNTKFEFGSLLQGVDQPPFFPVMAQAKVRIAQVDRLVGKRSDDIDVHFDDEYQAFGFPVDDSLVTYKNDGNAARRAKTDVYLDFKPLVLDPGSDGDRTGGPARPNTQLVAMSRSRGPVGNNNVPKSADGKVLSLAGGVPHSTGLDKLKPGDFFDGAKLLGIVDFKDVLVFVGDGISRTPQFREVTQYTSALLAEPGQDTAETVAKVRDQLLVPLRSALSDLARQFFAKVANTEFSEDEALNRLARLYPDVASAYREMRDALDEAIQLTATVKEVDALIEYFAAIYAAGRRFIAAIDRVANDPLAPVREALREAFNTQIADLISAAEKLIGLPTLDNDIKAGVTAIVADIRKLFTEALTSAALRAWKHLVLALPGAHSLPTGLVQYAKFVEDAVDAALAAVPKDKFVLWLENDELDVLATDLETAFYKEFTNQIGAAPGVAEKNALMAAEAAWRVGTGGIAGAAIRGLQFDSDVTLGKVRALLVSATDLSKAADIAGFSGALKAMVDAVAAMVLPVIELGQDATKLCDGAVQPFVTIFNETLYPPADFPQLKRARDTILPAMDVAIGEIRNLGLGLEGIAESIRDDIDTLFTTLEGLRQVLKDGAGNLATLTADICTASPTRLQLDALSMVKRTRRAFIDAVNRFQKSIKDTGSADIGGKLVMLMEQLVATGSGGATARATLVDAVKTMVAAEAAFCELTVDATSLHGVAGGQKALNLTLSALFSLRTNLPPKTQARIDQLIAMIVGATGTAATLYQEIHTVEQALDKKAMETVADLAELQYFQSVRDLAQLMSDKVDKIVNDLVEAIEQKLIGKIAEFLLGGGPYLDALISAGIASLKPVFEVLAKVQGGLVVTRNKVWGDLGCQPISANVALGTKTDSSFGDDLSNITLKKVCDLLLVPMPDDLRYGLVKPADDEPENDYLAAERNQLQNIRDAFGTKPTEVLAQLPDLFKEWGEGKSSVRELADRLIAAATAVLAGDLKRIVDLEGIRRRIEEKLRELVPSRIALNYDMHCDLTKVSDFFQPDPGSQITLAARATYDLLKNEAPQFSATCKVDAFSINLFNVVNLAFDGASFVNDSAKGSDFHVAYRDFTLGPSAEFLKPLESLMNPGVGGPFVRPASGSPGIEVGYVLDLGIISIGVMAFINVSITASCLLPFDNKQAVFTASIGREDRPVLLSCLPYVGGGFLTLYATAEKMIGFAASFEFGGGGAFAFGPLSGQGRISTGIYLRKLDRDVLIEGFFYVGGEARIACFAIAASLVVRVSHQSGGKMQGSAVFTYSFKIGFAKLRYSVGVHRTIGKGFSGSAMIAADLVAASKTVSSATIETLAYGLEQDWRAYQTYFSDINGFPQWPH
ncbi:hypothetical protein A9K65_013785 [Mesorhizobium sp. WSM1497]|uniref:hypothetical protein n=1 Tax=Mesorhizobium sp. WSM1497 TaxID=278153 RepID=UPI0007EC56E3|nr:hypothetical protein [Mesorhizobium sp. WSM1497]ARP64332.1 hypothetical protein A9K65_013785 [Mesorhizobium sp. WSM1497]